MYTLKSNNRISFLYDDDEIDSAFEPKKDPHSLFLLNYDLNILKNLPRDFTITTNNTNAKFNTELLKETSSVIFKFLKENPTNLQYHIDINDDEKVLPKFELLYLGFVELFEEEQLPISKKITKNLEITCCPNYMKPEILRRYDKGSNAELNHGVEMNKKSFNFFIMQKKHQTFQIKTKNNVYKINRYGIYSSKILIELLKQNPTMNEYEYDYEDKFNEFQPICQLFNFETIKITQNNAYSIKEIAEDLKIKPILDDLNKIIDDYENVSKKIDEQQTIIDSIEDLFNYLFNIKENGIEFVLNFIMESSWINSEDDVRELAAFIIQVSEINTIYHSYLSDLLIQLENEANEKNSLNILNPFIVSKLFHSFGKQITNCSFIYNLYKRNIISKEKLNNELRLKFSKDSVCDNSRKNNITIWFFSELIDLDMFDLLLIPKGDLEKYSRLISSPFKKWQILLKSFYPDKIELYKQMRDNGEPDNAITKSLRNDDIDTFQGIISKSKIDISKANIPYNIFDPFPLFNNINYINYAAAYGSIKCFKYLLLNHVELNKNSFDFAVYGGNIEIIKIVDQNIKNIDSPKACLVTSIMKHKNDLFDWIFEHKITKSNKIQVFFGDILYDSVKYGNAHSFIEIIDKGIDFSKNYEILIQKAAKKGFYQYYQLLDKLIDKQKIPITKIKNLSPFSKFGNFSIFKSCIPYIYSQKDFEAVLFRAIENDNFNIIQFILDDLLTEKFFKISSKTALNSLNKCIKSSSNDLFIYLINRLPISYQSFLNEFTDIKLLLIKSCKTENHEVVKAVSNLIIKYKPKEDFTYIINDLIHHGSFELCEYFVNNNFLINYEKVLARSDDFGSISEEKFMLLLNNCGIENIDTFYKCFLYPAIRSNNMKIVKFLLEKNAPYGNALIAAAESNDSEIVNLILTHNSKPYFINKKSKNGTALQIAAKQNNLQIVQKLLSIKGINPSLYDSNNHTPLVIAVTQLNLDILNAILDFYGDDIESQKWQLDEALKKFLDNADTRSKPRFNKHLQSEQNEKPFLPILKRILEIKNIDPNCHGKKYSLLSFACEHNEIDIVKMLLETEKININNYSLNDGWTPLMISIDRKNVEIAKLLIEDERTDINSRNYNDETALTIAVKKELIEIVDLLIHNKKFDPEESCINYAFFLSNDKTAKFLCQIDSLDVNYQKIKVDEGSYKKDGKYLSRETALIQAAKNNQLEMAEIIINHPSFDKYKSLIYEAIYKSILGNQVEIFRKLIEIENNNINLKLKQESLLYHSVMNCCEKIMLEILNNPNFDSEKSDLLNVFISGLMVLGNNSEMTNTLNKLCDYDETHEKIINFNQILPNGETFLTLKPKLYDYSEYITFLINRGSDPNIPNKEGIFPLEYAIESNSVALFNALVDTDLIDFEKKIPNKHKSFADDSNFKTYLHIAAQSENPDILSIILDKDLIDVNVTDDNGETALFDACRFKRQASAKYLFERDDLDYLHQNKNGDDALAVLTKLANGKYVRKEDRDDYFMAFFKIFNYLVLSDNRIDRQREVFFEYGYDSDDYGYDY